MATADKLTYLNTTKLLLRDAIRRAGHYLSDAATFRSYPYALLPDESSLSLDFVRGEYVARNWRDGTASRAGLSNIMTTTRASGGGYFDHLGVFQWAANNEPRIDHDPATVSTSTSSVTMASGSVTLAVSHLYPVGSYVRATHDGSNWMAGRVTASTGSSVTIWVDRVVGSGTFASWTVIRVRGLLVEESRTNLLTRSSDFANAAWGKVGVTISAHSAIGLNGPISAYAVIESNAFSQHLIFSSLISFTQGVTYSAFVYAKAAGRSILQHSISSGTGLGGQGYANFDLVNGIVGSVGAGVTAKMTSVGDGWYLCAVSFTSTATAGGSHAIFLQSTPSAGRASSYQGDGTSGIYIWGAQLEAGAFPTSYIPTTAAQVTRAADQCVVSNLADWYRADEFTIVASAVRTQPRTSSIYELEMTGADRIWNRSNTVGTSEQLVVTVGSVNQAVFTPAAALNHKSAFAVKANAFSASVNGAVPLTDSSGSVPSGITVLRIGTSDGGARLNGHIESLQYIPRALSNTELQRITA